MWLGSIDWRANIGVVKCSVGIVKYNNDLIESDVMRGKYEERGVMPSKLFQSSIMPSKGAKRKLILQRREN